MLEYESKTYSQQGEDGILRHIFRQIGTTNKVAVEIGVSAGGDTNTRLLAENGWHAYWFDCDPPFFVPERCTFVEKFLTKDNAADALREAGVPDQFDLLSIDIDSNDYYIRDALKTFSPRVCVIEYNGYIGHDEQFVMPYDEQYRWHPSHRAYGASLRSLFEQGQTLGYDLVYCDSQGVNAFFVRKDVNVFRPLAPKDAWVKIIWS